MRLKLIRWLFISVLCIFVMSHNSYAVVVGSFNVSIKYGNWRPTVYFCVQQVDTGESVNGQCGSRYWASATNGFNYSSSVHTSTSGIKFNTPSGIQLKYNDIITQEFDVVQLTANNSNDTGAISFSSNTSGFQVLDTTYEQLDNTTGKIKIMLWVSSDQPSGSRSVQLMPARAPQPPDWTWNFVWLQENQSYLISGVQNVYSINDNSQAIVDAINNNNSSGAINDLKDEIEAQNDQENAAIDNINNQTPPSSGSGENATTTSLLGTIGNFISALQNLSATDCMVDLNFPSFAGGTQRVNVCQNKEFTGNIVSIGSSVLLVAFYIPVAFMLINKIYSEIRSFTNG